MQNLITQHLDIWTAAHKTRSTAGRGSSNKLDLYGIKKLRELILELAVRGKLVPQDASDEPASELLKKIATERAKQTKNVKLLPQVEEAEWQFELPHGWQWVRLGNVINFINGYAFKSSDFTDQGIGIVKIGDIQNGELTPDTMSRVDPTVVENIDLSLRVESGDLLIAMSGATTGKLGFNTTDEHFYLNQRVGKISPYLIEPKYLYFPLTTKIAENLEKSLGSAIPNLSTAQINDIVFALPPFAEQARIVAKVDELMAFCDQLEQTQSDNIAAHAQLVEALLTTLTNSSDHNELQNNWQRIAAHFDTLFTTEHSIDQLKQTILQLAVTGKLVPQNPNDEPASELLKKIATEKAQLIKEGKIKKEKPLPEITDEEKPFELPIGWEFVRKNQALNFLNGYAFKSEWFQKDGVRLLRNVNISHGVTNWSDAAYVSDNMANQFNEFSLSEGDIVLTLDRPIISTGLKCAVIQKDDLPCLLLQRVARLSSYADAVSDKFLLLWLNSNYFIGALDPGRSNGVPHISTTQVGNMVIPLPSLNEQHRIVAKVDELMALCDTLKTNLQNAQTTQLALADALVEQAVV